MTDFKINPTTDDFVITQGRPEMVADVDAKAQRIRSRLLTVRGEWFLDTTFGLDYYGVIWVKSTPRSVLAAHVKREILRGADRGDKITEFDMDYTGATRTLSVTTKLVSEENLETNVSI